MKITKSPLSLGLYFLFSGHFDRFIVHFNCLLFFIFGQISNFPSSNIIITKKLL
jgi:hypothetical protein